MHLIEKDWTTKNGLRAVVIICQERDGTQMHRCGYVGVPKGNVLYGVKYSDHIPALERYSANAVMGQKSPILILTAGVDAPEGQTIRACPETIFDVHGGITYSGTAGSYPVESDLHWFGFDCAHCDDAPITPSRFGFERDGIVRSLKFCVSQCENLAQQIVETTFHSSTVPADPSRA